jgi:plasmid stability protein
MPDLTIHGIDQEVMERLRLDAEATGQSVEEIALHILTNWHGLLANRNEVIEEVRQFHEDVKEIPKTMTSERVAELERLRTEYERRLRVKPDTQGAVAGQGQASEMDRARE